MKKKLLSMTLIVAILALIPSFNGFAMNVEPTSEVKPMYVPCPVSGQKHDMYNRGTRQVFIDGELVLSGYTTQCIHCNDCIISENNPTYSWTTNLGYYGYWSASEEVGSYLRMDVDELYYNDSLANDSFFQAFVFH